MRVGGWGGGGDGFALKPPLIKYFQFLKKINFSFLLQERVFIIVFSDCLNLSATSSIVTGSSLKYSIAYRSI